MKSSELRIGNLFNPENPVKVEGWMLVDESKVDFQPIALTEKWLLDFGFKKDSNGHYRIYHGRNIPVRLWKRGEDDWVCIKSNARPKYVHQLQNLYFALTGEELKIKTTSSTSQ